MPDDRITKIVCRTLQELTKYAAKFAELNSNPRMKFAVMEECQAVAEEQIKLGSEFTQQFDYQAQNINTALRKQLPARRLTVFKKALKLPAFESIAVTDEKSKKISLKMYLSGEELFPVRVMESRDDVHWATCLLYSGILVDSTVFLVHAAGISLTTSKKTMRITLKKTADNITDKFAKCKAFLDTFIANWKQSGDDLRMKGGAVFQLIMDSNSQGIMGDIIKELLADLTGKDWLVTSARIFAMIVAAMITDGVVLVAMMSFIVADAELFAKKIESVYVLCEETKHV